MQRIARMTVSKYSSSTITASLPQTMEKYNSFLDNRQLPRLPVPTLEETMKKYLHSLKPLLSAKQYEISERAANEFLKPDSIGHQLQQRLLNRAAALSDSSWLIDWWNEFAYLGYRDSVVINVNYYFHFEDDKSNCDQISRAASLIQAALVFRALQKDATKKHPLDMVQYKYMFNTCRIPLMPSDITKVYDQFSNKHVCVVSKNKFYVFDVVSDSGSILSTADIKKQLDYINKLTDKGPAISALTTEKRDTWTNLRQQLMNISQENKDNLEKIESSLFLICLDENSPQTREEVGRLLWHGDGNNRFFDKSLQFIVFKNGKAGFNGEHSMMDGIPTSKICEFMIENLKLGKINHGNQVVSSNLQTPQALNFLVDSNVEKGIFCALDRLEKDIKGQELANLVYESYGKNSIKAFNFSPDAFVQMAIQLAYFKMYAVCRPTYESSQTRKFAYGRTETTRSVSEESAAWVKSMGNSEVKNDLKLALLKKAINAHNAYMADATEGKGVDRHLLGLRTLLKPGEKKPEIFNEAYDYSCHWFLSTSQITSEYFDGYGWGEVVPDGYGVPYMIKDESIHFTVTSTHLKSKMLCQHLKESLDEMKLICDSSDLKAKL